jgi:hypothetical protein
MLSGHDILDGNLTEFYEFRHLTFQEYLTAKAIVEGWYPARDDADTLVSQLEKHFTDEKWREVVPLAAVLAGRRAEPIVQRLIDGCGKNITIAQRLAKCLADEVQVTRNTIQSSLEALLGRAGWTAERRLIGTGKYGELLRAEAGARYLNDVTLARDQLFRVIGEVVLTIVDGNERPIWEELKTLLTSSDRLSRCEGALALKLVEKYPPDQYFKDIVDILVSLLRSETIPERIAICAALHQIGHKKFRKSQPDPSAFFARAALLQPLLEHWLTENDGLLQAMAVRVICVMPLTPKITLSQISRDIAEVFFGRAQQGWSSFSLDEKVATLVTAFHTGGPWDSEHLLPLCIGFSKDCRGYRSKKLANLIGALGGEVPEVGARSRRRRLALADTPNEAADFLNGAARC